MSLNDDSRPSTPQSQAPAALSAQKADQIASRFFIKFLLILVSARSTSIEHGPRSSKVDKWVRFTFLAFPEQLTDEFRLVQSRNT